MHYILKYDCSRAMVAVGASAPSNILEAMCIVGLVFAVAVQTITSGGCGMQVMELATFRLSVFRILPYIGSIWGSVNTITYNAPGLWCHMKLFMKRRNLKKENHL